MLLRNILSVLFVMIASTFAFRPLSAARRTGALARSAMLSMKNPRVFFDIDVAGKPQGRVTFELYADVVPKTAGKLTIDDVVQLTLHDQVITA
jgi:hypothetical protein